jgi:peptide/nickel transport system substrate-binding protein/glutathione transport system substrate-binding protein
MRDRQNPTALNRRTLLQGATSLGGALLLPRGLGAQEAPRRGGTLRISMTYNPAALDPMTGRNAPDFNALMAIYDPLIDIDPQTLEARPGLATAWTWKDSKTLVLDLRQGVKFHDGTAFDAEVVKFNLDRARNDSRSNLKADMNPVDAVEVTGSHQVVIRLNRPNYSLPTILAYRPGLMVSPTSIKNAQGGNVDRTPVGTGPFKFVSWQDNDRIVLTRNENYWKPGLPYLDGMVMRIITEQATGLRSVIAGENDFAINIDIQSKAIADRASNVVVQLFPSMFFWGGYLNISRPPFDNVKIRQALSWGIDREAMNKVIALGLNTPGNGVLPKQHWACDPETFNYYTYSPEKARALLAEAGHPDGIDIPVLGWSDQSSMQRQEVAVSQLAKAGIRLQITPGSPQETAIQFFGPTKKGAARLSGMGGFADPAQQYDNLFSKDSFFNAGGIELPGYRELIATSQATEDRNQRKVVLAKLQRFVIENALLVTFLFQTNPVVSHPKVKGIIIDLSHRPRFHEAWLAA